MVRILVVTSCTGDKVVETAAALTISDFEDPRRRGEREVELANLIRPAGEMYSGQQHVCLMRGVADVRDRFGRSSVDVRILSAGYGLVSETQPVAPYDVTFSTMTTARARAWAEQLGAARAVRDAIGGIPLVVFLLGERYLEAIRPPLQPEPGQRLLFLAKPSLRARLTRQGVTVVSAGKDEAKRFRAGLVALKGKMFELFASALVREPRLWEDVLADDTPAAFIRGVESSNS